VQAEKKRFCVYAGPTPEVIRRTANDSGSPVDRITALDPYFYF